MMESGLESRCLFVFKNPDVLVLGAGFFHYTRASKSTWEYPQYIRMRTVTS